MNDNMNFFKKLSKSFYDFESYRYFVSESLGKGIKYLFILVLLTATITSISMGVSISKGKSEGKNFINNEMPDFKITDGILSIDEEMPLFIENTNDLRNDIFIIDTEDNTDLSALDSYSRGFIVYSDRILIKNSSSVQEFTELYYGEIFKTDIDKTTLIGYVDTFLNILLVAIFILSPLVSFIGKLLSLFVVMGLGGMILASILKVNLSYSKICTISCYALTVPIFLNTIANVFDFNSLPFTLVYYLIGFVYLFLGMKKISEEDLLDMDY